MRRPRVPVPVPVLAPFLFMVTALVPAVRPAAAQIIETPETKVIPRLTVRGEAELEKPADQLHMTVGVVTENTDAREALAENSTRMAAVVKAVRKTGITKDEFQTGRFRIRPVYTRRPRGADAEWVPEIRHYEVVNTLAIKTKNLDLAGDLIEAANAAGANQIDDIGFGLARARAHRSEAISKATSHALRDASTLAEAAGVRLVRLLSINLDQASWRSPVGPAIRGRAAMAEPGAAPPITAGDVTITAEVSVVYEIAPIDGE